MSDKCLLPGMHEECRARLPIEKGKWTLASCCTLVTRRKHFLVYINGITDSV
jgi:hypothetical protein